MIIRTSCILSLCVIPTLGFSIEVHDYQMKKTVLQNSFKDGSMPSIASNPNLPSDLRKENDLTAERVRIQSSKPYQFKGNFTYGWADDSSIVKFPEALLGGKSISTRLSLQAYQNGVTFLQEPDRTQLYPSDRRDRYSLWIERFAFARADDAGKINTLLQAGGSTTLRWKESEHEIKVTLVKPGAYSFEEWTKAGDGRKQIGKLEVEGLDPNSNHPAKQVKIIRGFKTPRIIEEFVYSRSYQIENTFEDIRNGTVYQDFRVGHPPVEATWNNGPIDLGELQKLHQRDANPKNYVIQIAAIAGILLLGSSVMVAWRSKSIRAKNAPAQPGQALDQ